MTSVRVAAIDCGTNSIRLLITEIDGNQKVDELRQMRVVRLGQGVDETKTLAPEAIERTLSACREYASAIAAVGVDVVSFAATSAVRDASNAREFGDAVEQILGVRPQVWSGEAEAAASFEGATGESAKVLTTVIDLGGGSTEVVQGFGTPSFAHSFNLGSVRMTERFLSSDPATVDEVAACMNYLDGELKPTLSRLEPAAQLVGVAGSITTIAAHALGLSTFDHERIHLARIPIPQLREACLSLVRLRVTDRRALGFMHPGRADVIGGGALVLDRVLEHLPLDCDEVLISEHDILDGIAWAAARGH